jgi:hypothetical protein
VPASGGREDQTVLPKRASRAVGTPVVPALRGGARSAGAAADTSRYGCVELRSPGSRGAGAVRASHGLRGWLFSLEAAEAVCGPGMPEEKAILEILASLVDDSLVVSRVEASSDPGGDEPRFTMLETVREYAAERLGADGESEEVHRAHAMYYLELAEAAQPEVSARMLTGWLRTQPARPSEKGRSTRRGPLATLCPWKRSPQRLSAKRGNQHYRSIPSQVEERCVWRRHEPPPLPLTDPKDVDSCFRGNDGSDRLSYAIRRTWYETCSLMPGLRKTQAFRELLRGGTSPSTSALEGAR